MHYRNLYLMLLGLTICLGCGRAKSTDELLADVHSDRSATVSSPSGCCPSARPTRPRSFRR